MAHTKKLDQEPTHFVITVEDDEHDEEILFVRGSTLV